MNPVRSAKSRRRKILYFEDDAFLRGMYQTKFQNAGFDVAGYESPTQSPVDVVIREQPDLILMDGIMPDIDGVKATVLLKSDARTRNIPILGLDNIGGEYANKAKRAGMADYMVKATHRPSEVVARVCEILGIPIPKGAHVSQTVDTVQHLQDQTDKRQSRAIEDDTNHGRTGWRGLPNYVVGKFVTALIYLAVVVSVFWVIGAVAYLWYLRYGSWSAVWERFMLGSS
ncbi:MAG: response regulator [Patescibacteria group bacterium]|jgi:CheY-like chemotaxis protein